MATEETRFIDRFMRKSVKSVSSFLQNPASPSSFQENLALSEMMRSTKTAIEKLGIGPDEVSKYLPMNDPIAQDLFDSYVRYGFKKITTNKKFHDFSEIYQIHEVTKYISQEMHKIQYGIAKTFLSDSYFEEKCLPRRRHWRKK